MILKRMVKEEWRTQSKLYKGRNLALLPALVFLITFIGALGVEKFSTAPVEDIGLLITAFGFFTGLAAGSIGFSGSDAAKNVLGDANFLVFSSRTLPVRKTRLITCFLLKDLLFYTGLYLVPVAAAAVLVSPGLKIYAFYMSLLFVSGLALSLVAANTAVGIPSRLKLLNYGNIPAPPVARKSVLDVSRSSGGLFKILMSIGVLLGLYYYIVNYVPIASYLLSNPLMSFSVVLGMMSVSIYNWLNTYDTGQDYLYLPLQKEKLLKSKFKAFKAISAALIVPTLTLSYLVYGGNLLLSIATGYITAYYIGAITMHEAGLNPNEEMINAVTFTKFLMLVNVLVVPLLALTSLDLDPVYTLGLLVPMAVIAKIIEKRPVKL